MDAWLNSMTDESMEDALKFFIQEYLTSLGSNAKTPSATEVFDAVNDVYKAQLKAIHYLGKGFKSEIESVRRDTTHKVNKLKLQYASDFPKVDGIFKQLRDEKMKTEKLDGSIVTISSAISKITNQVTQQISQNNEANALVQLMWRNQYGDKLPSKVPVHTLTKFEVERLQA